MSNAIAQRADAAGRSVAHIKRVLEESESFLSGLDRSRLGRFAASEELILWADATARNQRMQETGAVDSDDAGRLKLKASEVFSRYPRTSIQHAIAEAYLWWEKSDNADLWQFSQPHPESWTHEKMKELRTVFNNEVETHEYFAVGIWDVPSIYRFIENDIDPELAVSL